MATPIAIVAYLALFAGATAIFLLVNLLVGRLLRPNAPNEEKLEVYECGEPTIGSSFVQFDLRFYVVALLFIIFDVEVAFFFPWATVFGKATQLASPNMPTLMADVEPGGSAGELSPHAIQRFRELGIAEPMMPQISDERALEIGAGSSVEERNRAAIQDVSQRIVVTSVADIAVFFAVLMVGFAYVWRRGDLDWVRAVVAHRREAAPRPPPQQELPAQSQRPAGSILSA